MMGILRALLCAAILGLACQAHAQSWPTRPVKLIVPTGPGHAVDIMARILASGVSQSLGQTVFVRSDFHQVLQGLIATTIADGLHDIPKLQVAVEVELGNELSERTDPGFGRVEKRQQRVAAVNQMDLRAERGKGAGIFASDYPCPNHRQTLWKTFQL